MTQAPPRPMLDQRALIERVRHIIFQAGGINSASRARLAALASAHQLTMPQLAALIRAVGAAEEIEPASGWSVSAPMAPPARVSVPLTAAPTTHPAPPQAADDLAPAVTVTRTHASHLRIAAIVMLALSALLAMRLLIIVVGAIQRTPPRDAIVQQAPALDATAITASAAAGLQSLTLPDAAALDSRELFQALSNLDQHAFAAQPQAAQAIFERAVAALAEQWLTLEPDLVEDITVLLRDAIAAAGQHDLPRAVEMTDALLEPAQQLVAEAPAQSLTPSAVAFATAWAGAVDTLRLPPEVERRVRALRTTLPRESTRRPIEADFWRGASVGLERMALQMVEQEAGAAAWERWSQTAQAFARIQPKEGVITLARALTHVLRDKNASRTAAGRQALSIVAQRIDWRADDAIDALLRWFEDPSISSEHLAFLVRELVESRALPGLPADTRLDADADAEARTRVRDAFALTVGRPLRATDAFALRWRRATDDLLAATPARGATAARQAAVAAYLCAAAAQRVVGQDDDAERAVDLALAAVDASDALAASPSDVIRTGRWGELFLAARRDEQARLELLYLLMNEGGPSTQLEADLLAETAAFGAPRSVQQLAQRIIIDLPDDLRIVDGLLKALPLAASSNDGLSEVIERKTARRLPQAGDDGWRDAAQQALAERWLELQSVTQRPPFGEAPSMLADAYELSTAQMRASVGALPEAWAAPQDLVPEAVAQDPARAAAELWNLWRRRAERLPEGLIAIAPLAELVARRSGRLALARGPVQRFAAEQASVAELIAYATAIEQPVRAESAASIIASMRAEARSAASVYEQINRNERSILRLWRLRLGFEEQTQ
ncbi:MAG: hypothetical protein KDA20_06380 [Phycisphaerales bacterium]|nr:hypothetical protein [Phycisphaerales bacterium]